MAYRNSMNPANQLPFADSAGLFWEKVRITRRTMLPDNNRTVVKLAASMAPDPKANRHNTEFAANAVSANPVRMVVLSKVLPVNFYFLE